MTKDTLTSAISFGAKFSKLSLIGRIATAAALIYVAFLFGNCTGKTDLDKFLVQYKEYQTQAKNAVTYGDSLKAEVSKLQDSVKRSDSVVKELTVSISFKDQRRKALSSDLKNLEEQLTIAKSERNDSLTIVTQDTIIVNLKTQVATADSVIDEQRQVIKHKDSQIRLLSSALDMSTQRGDSLTTILKQLPPPPKKETLLGIPLPNKKVTGAIAFVAGVLVARK